MTTWQRFAPSNQTILTHQHNSQVEDSPSDPPGLLLEETLEFQVEYPQEEAEEVEEVEEAEEAAEEEVSLRPHQRNKQTPMGETNSSAIRRSYLQEIAHSQRHS